MFKTSKAVREAAESATRAIERAEAVADDIPQGAIVGITMAALVLATVAIVIAVVRK